MSAADRLRETEAELLRVVRNQIQVMHLPQLEAALREYEEARSPEANPSRRLRRMARR